MARTKGAVNLSTMIKKIQEAGRYRAGLEDEPRDKIKALYESVLMNASAMPTAKPLVEGAVVYGNINGTANVAPTTVEAQKPPEPTQWQKVVDAKRQAVRERIERDQAAARAAPRTPVPCSPDTLLDATVIEGRPVSEWNDLMEARRAASEPGIVLSFADLPGWACWAVDKWKQRGAPTVRGQLKNKIEDLTSKANKEEEKAAKEEAEAATAEKEKTPKLAKKKRESAEARRVKAAEYRKQAEEIATQNGIKV